MIDFDPGAPPSVEFDKGPPIAIARHFASLPPIAPEHRDLFWYDWGPVFYRGRLNGTAKVLGIASDPGPTERLVGRTLVGDAGQRVQGFLTKLGLTTSYALVNAFPLAVHPSKVSKALPLLKDSDQLAWRNRFYDLITDSRLEAIIAFGGNAQAALRLWDSAPEVPTFEIPHPSAHNGADLAARWAAAIPAARAAVTPDPGGDQTGPNYGGGITEADYARIPHADLPYGQPIWIGDDRWGRTDSPRHNNTLERAAGDPDHTMTWQAPRS
jgi:uracil-DNA glycosylase